VIDDLDDSLRELLIQSVPLDPASVDIGFDMPGKDWAAALTKPAVNLFLYDIRENHDLRSNERFITRNPTSASEARAPARMDLTYLVSAWAAQMDDEHKLLGNVLRALLANPLLPTAVLKGTMAGQPYPLHAWIAQPERTPNAWDFWGGLDGRLKAGISYVVTVALETAQPVEVELVTEKVLKINAR
jgi:hypothetical protein